LDQLDHGLNPDNKKNKIIRPSDFKNVMTEFAKTFNGSAEQIKMIWEKFPSLNPTRPNDSELSDAFVEFGMIGKKRNLKKLSTLIKQKYVEKNYDKIRNNILTEICQQRLKEGLFINDSLKSLRSFISYFVTNIQKKEGLNKNAKFIDECAPLQCNPYYKDCFGDSTVLNEEMNINSVIATQIRKQLCCTMNNDQSHCALKNCLNFENLTFCVFNIINLSKNIDNPPPIPHIDLTNLMSEYNRLETLNEEIFNTGLTKVEKSISGEINDNDLDTNVHKIYLDDIETKIKYLDDENQEEIKRMINSLRDGKNTLSHLRNLIDYINTTNSLTTIGTLEFTDMISKFGLNRVTCNYRYDQNELRGVNEEKAIKQSIDEAGRYVEELKVVNEKYVGFINNVRQKYGNSVM
jgi:hypothetical protein